MESLKELRDRIRVSECRPWTIENLPFSDEEKEIILEYLASRLWQVLLNLKRADPGVHGKWYDPLLIKDGEAHSYLFDLEDGGRHHAFRDFSHLESMLLAEVVKWIQEEPIYEEV